MPIYQGSNKIGDFYSGSNSIGWGYVGSVLVYQKGEYTSEISTNNTGILLVGYSRTYTITAKMPEKVTDYTFVTNEGSLDNGTNTSLDIVPNPPSAGGSTSLTVYGVTTWNGTKVVSTKNTLSGHMWANPRMYVSGSFNDSTGAFSITSSYAPTGVGLSISRSWKYQTKEGGSWTDAGSSSSVSGTISEGDYRNYQCSITFTDSANHTKTISDNYEFERSVPAYTVKLSPSGTYAVFAGTTINVTITPDPSSTITLPYTLTGYDSSTSSGSYTITTNSTSLSYSKSPAQGYWYYRTITATANWSTGKSASSNAITLTWSNPYVSMEVVDDGSEGTFEAYAGDADQTGCGIGSGISVTIKWYRKTSSSGSYSLWQTVTAANVTVSDSNISEGAYRAYYFTATYTDSTGATKTQTSSVYSFTRPISYTVSISKNYTNLHKSSYVTYTATPNYSGVTKYVFVIGGTSYDNGTSKTYQYKPDTSSMAQGDTITQSAYVIAYWGSDTATSSTVSVNWRYPKINTSSSSSKSGTGTKPYTITAKISSYKGATGLTVSTYQWYYSSNGSSYTKSTDSSASTATYTSGALASGQTRYYYCMVGFKDDTGSLITYQSEVTSCTTG